jgi:hypothetical protein
VTQYQGVPGSRLYGNIVTLKKVTPAGVRTENTLVSRYTSVYQRRGLRCYSIDTVVSHYRTDQGDVGVTTTVNKK